MNNVTDNAAAQIPRKYSNSFLFFGIALLILGIVAVGSQFLFTMGTVIFFGALLLMAGVSELIHTIVSKQEKKMFNVLSSIAYIVTGCLTLGNPLLGALSLTLIMAAFFVISGMVRIAYGVAHRHEGHWGWFILGGIINLILGLMIAVGWPATGLWMIGLFVGIEMIFHGTSWIMLALVLKTNKA